mgnify:CR=1 FL=1
MKDKNSIIGWVLIALVFIGFMMYSNHNATQQAEQAKIKHTQDSIQQVKADSINAIENKKAEERLTSETTDSTNAFFAARQGKEGETILENELLKVTISNKGGQIKRAEILDPTYKSREGGNVVLFDGEDSHMEFLFNGKTDNIVTSEFNFTPKDAGKNHVTMSLPISSGSIDIDYKLIPDSYLLTMDVHAVNLQNFFNADMKKMQINWSEDMKQQEKGYSFENRYSTITYHEESDDTDELSSAGADDHEEGEDIDERMKWIAFKTQFFSQILISDGLFTTEMMDSKMLKEGSGYLKSLATTTNVEFDPSGKHPTNLKMYLGPNKFSTLKENEAKLNSSTELDLQSIVYLGWPIIRWINRFVFLYLFDFMTSWGWNMGLILILITIIVKICVFPLMKKSYKSSAYMRVLKPQMEELNKKYPNKEDAMMKNQEMMQIYSQYGVSPMGGCLPMLIQMPIWIALFNFIPNAIELRGQSFLWADDLSTYDNVINFSSSIWGIGDHLSLFCVLWCITTWVNTWISMRQQSYNATMSPEQQQSMGCMKWFSYLMPLIFFFSFNSYSSGLNLYYFVSGLISILMMWYLRASTDDAKLLKELEAKKKERKNNPQKRGGSLMERMQAMAEQQRALQEQQKRGR